MNHALIIITLKTCLSSLFSWKVPSVGLCPGIPASVTLEDLRETVQRTRRQHDWWQLAVLIDTAQLLNPFCAGSFSVSTSESSIRLPALRRNSESVKGLNLNTFKLYTGAALSVPPSPPGIPSLRPESTISISVVDTQQNEAFFLRAHSHCRLLLDMLVSEPWSPASESCTLFTTQAFAYNQTSSRQVISDISWCNIWLEFNLR